MRTQLRITFLLMMLAIILDFIFWLPTSVIVFIARSSEIQVFIRAIIILAISPLICGLALSILVLTKIQDRFEATLLLGGLIGSSSTIGAIWMAFFRPPFEMNGLVQVVIMLAPLIVGGLVGMLVARLAWRINKSIERKFLPDLK